MNQMTFSNTRPDTLCTMLAYQANARPDELSVLDDKGSLSFAELFRNATLIARAIGTDDDIDTGIGLYCEPSIDLVRGAWGIIMSGHAYIPLAPEYPEERLHYIIGNSGTRKIVTQPHLRAQLETIAPTGTEIITLDAAPAADQSVLPMPQADDLAYVIYTSGSTGKPKGVMIEHRSIVSQMHWLSESGYLTPGERILQKTPMSFDAAQWEILAPAVGATVVAGRPNLYRDTDALIEKIRTHEVSILQCVPTLLQALIDHEDMQSCISLRSVFSGGEALSKKLARQFFDTLPDRRLINLYGPTECTINATAHEVTAEDLQGASKSVSIGRAVDGARCYILDDQMRPVTDGSEGELYIGGIQVARGYVARPDQTAERFMDSPFVDGDRLYRSGDVCLFNPDGTIQFAGRADTQIKLRGYRVELEEISLAIENHHWVRHAAAIVTRDPRSNSQVLNACVEMNEKEAAVMDQGVAGAHHQSKSNKLQVKAQLSAPGLRDAERDAGRHAIELPGAEESDDMRRAVFARKTYRFYEGGKVALEDINNLLADWFRAPVPDAVQQPLTIDVLGEVLRWFGRFTSEERLLPKYAYASPGALYATQLYIECHGVDGVDDGIHYYHPRDHRLIKMSDIRTAGTSRLRLHFAGKKSAIEPVYKNNILEVLEMETGHMVGVFERVLGRIGYSIQPSGHLSSAMPYLDMAAEDYYLGAFDCVPGMTSWRPDVDILVQPCGRGISGLENATYLATPETLDRISDDVLRNRHVIAINQRVFDRSSVGFSVVSRERQEWLNYVALGFVMHKFQANGSGFGFMSSGYSSKSGNPLPASTQIDRILQGAGLANGACYFFVGGLVSEDQRLSQGMNEDAVHMQGPAEMIKEELARTLPDYMIPNRVIVFDKMPLTANGKVDRKAVEASDRLSQATSAARYVAPQTRTEIALAEIWAELLHYDEVSREDDFFAVGGNSLTAISTLNKISAAFDLRLPVQTIFESPRLQDLARRIDAGADPDASRFVTLNANRSGRPVFCWPGLGGYPMNLRTLAQSLTETRPFFGIQSRGINAGETPFDTITEMARADVAEIELLQPEGLITLWGYSFGARVAFETAWQLEQSGRKLDQLVLICPGNPRIEPNDGQPIRRDAVLTNRTYVAILLSVFMGKVDLGLTDLCLQTATTPESFAEFVHAQRPALELPMIHRIMQIVGQTYEFEYNFRELQERQITAPITIIKAQGDDYSFIENESGFSEQAPRIVNAQTDHYQILKDEQAAELASLIHNQADRLRASISKISAA